MTDALERRAAGAKKSGVCFYTVAWRGGDGWYSNALATELAAALADEGRRLIYVGSKMLPEDRSASHANLERYEIAGGSQAEWPKLRKVTHNGPRVLNAFWQLLRARLRADTYVITFSHWLLVSILQFALIRLSGAEIVYIVHDPLPHAWGFPKPFQGLERWILTTMYRLSNRLVILTKGGKEVLAEEFGIPRERITVIPHGVFDDGEKPALRSNTTFLIFGMLRRNKNILAAIKAFKALAAKDPAVRLVIAGAPYASEMDYWAECEAEIAGIRDQVRTEIGFVAEERLKVLFDEADAILLPYKQFTSQSGVAVLAAMSMRPVVATAAGGIVDLFELGMAGERIALPADIEQIRDAMERFRRADPDEWRARTRASRESLLETLSWRTIGRSLAAVVAG